MQGVRVRVEKAVLAAQEAAGDLAAHIHEATELRVLLIEVGAPFLLFKS
jgi:hypothetical protein